MPQIGSPIFALSQGLAQKCLVRPMRIAKPAIPPKLPRRRHLNSAQSAWRKAGGFHYNPLLKKRGGLSRFSQGENRDSPLCTQIFCTFRPAFTGMPMVGQGGPRASRERRLPAAISAAAARVWRFAPALLLLLSASLLKADDLRVRIAWGGGAERVWHGTISISDGVLAEPRPLGFEADEPGSMWFEGRPESGAAVALPNQRGGSATATPTTELVVQQRSSRGYDGLDLLVAAPATAKLLVQLSADGEDDRDERDRPVFADGKTGTAPTKKSRPAVIEIPLADLSGEFVNKELDRQGNRLLAMRTPGDSLRVRFSRESLVFAPGETFRFTLEPNALPLPKGSNARVRVQLVRDGGKEIWSVQHDVQGDRPEPIPLEVALPDEEGVYDIVITAVNNPPWSQAVRQPLNWKRTIAERSVQVLVLNEQRPKTSRADRDFKQVVEIDPANPRWYEKYNKLPQLQLTKNRLTRLWKGPLGNDCLQTRKHALGELAQLKPNRESPDVSWEAYWLPISQPGRPHILEVDYPSDVPQTLGLCILEPNAAGALTPLGLNSGVDNGAAMLESGEKPHWQKHRLVFWPRTATPLLLVSNGRQSAPAVYGKIRVLEGGERLPRALPGRTSTNRRLLAAYLDRPLIPQIFSADECLDPPSGRSLDDWWTFYEGGTRLVEYLNYSGCNALMLAVSADGSAIYPSAVLQPTPRYDTGAFFASGQDPVGKDVLEMLLRLFDREDLQLIPTVEFAAPLPELEEIRRGGGPSTQGIEWIGSDGTSWSSSSPPQRGLGPYYNVLHPRVQQAMLGVLRELASRYANHPSFTGLAVRLSADGYAQLPGSDWGLDDATIARFEQDAKLRVPGSGPQRFAQRSAFLAQEPQHQAWLDWRAAQLAKFYRPRQQRACRDPARLPTVPGRGRHDRRAGTRSRTASGVAPANDHRLGPIAGGHRCASFRRRIGRNRPLAARTHRAGRESRQSSRRPGDRADGGHRPLFSDRLDHGQLVFSPATRNSHRVVRPEKSFQTRRPLAGKSAGALGRTESAAFRPQPSHARFADHGRRRLDVASRARGIGPQPCGRLSFPAGGSLPANWPRRRQWRRQRRRRRRCKKRVLSGNTHQR